MCLRSPANFLLALLLMAAAASAHERVPPSSCSAPERPESKEDADRWNAFVDAVDVYRACISRTVDREQAASAAHQAAAQAAAEAWNRFVRDALNAPEDFPWPPEPRD
jgi:hypothetical protein